MTDRFGIITNVRGDLIYDDLTGKGHKVNPVEMVDLLNSVNERADRNAEKCYKMMEDNYRILRMILVLSEKLEDYDKVMRKYEINSVEKLDRILFERGVW